MPQPKFVQDVNLYMCSYDYTQHDIGKYITSIGGVPEDLEAGVYWFLYKLKADPDPLHPPTKDQLTSKGKLFLY